MRPLLAKGRRDRGETRCLSEFSTICSHTEVNFGAPEHVNLNFEVPEELVNQSPEIDQLNEELSVKYMDIQNLRDSIAEYREVVPNDKLSHMKQIEVILNEYRDMRSRCADLRGQILRMDPPGMPFNEPEGFDVLP